MMQSVPIAPLIILALVFAVIGAVHLLRRAQARRQNAVSAEQQPRSPVVLPVSPRPPAPLQAPPSTAAKPGKILIPSEGSDIVYEKDLSSPFWADVAKMQPGAFVKYQSIYDEWHVFTVVDGPKYGRREIEDGDLSVVVRRVSTGQVFTLPKYSVRSCPPSFASRDGTKVKRGEGWR